MEITLPLDEYLREDGKELLLEKKVKHQGIWVIHLSDADPWPSNPHADRQDDAEKLNLLNGFVYDKINRQYKYELSKKSMRYIYGKIIKHEYSDVVARLESQKSKITYL